MSVASESSSPGRHAAPQMTAMSAYPPAPGVIILAHRDAQKIANEIKRLLDAEGRYTTIYFGIEADAFVVPNPVLDRVVVIWSEQSCADIPLRDIAKAALSQQALVEVQIADVAPEIAGRTAPPVSFINWNQTRAGQWKVFVDRLSNTSHRDLVTSDHAKFAAASLMAASGFIAFPAIVTRALEVGMADPGATSIVAPIVEQVDFAPQTIRVSSNMRLDEPPPIVEDAFIPVQASRLGRIRTLPVHAAPRIAALESAAPLVEVEFRRRGIVSQMLAAAEYIPLRPDERSQSN